MLSKFDDFPIHQTPEPVAHPATSDKDVYERYWFNGYSKSGDFYLGAGAALYQHLGVKDAHVSFIHEGRQYAFHVSGRRTDEPSDMTIGPYSLEIIEPMRTCRITVTENDSDFTCDLLWEGRTGTMSCGMPRARPAACMCCSMRRLRPSPWRSLAMVTASPQRVRGVRPASWSAADWRMAQSQPSSGRVAGSPCQASGAV